LFFTEIFSHRCLGLYGETVDWWAMLKTSAQSSSTNAYVKNGTSFAYVDSKTTSLQFLSADVTSKTSPLGRTLLPVYHDSPELSFMYNDETPDGKTSGSYGHTKGVISYKNKEGFWLIHSVPAFPPAPPNEYGYSTKANIYGQSFLCTSLNAANLNKVGILQQHNHPQIYHSNISSDAASLMPDLAAAMKGTSKTGTPATTIQKISTLGGANFTGYGKNAPWGQDLQPNLIIPDIKADMVWETWMRPYEAPFCPARPAKQCYSAATLSGALQSGGTYNWKETEDHSKWGVTTETSKPYTCIGDINRMTSQRKRGGGAMCTTNPTVHRMFLGLIKTKDSCNNTEFARLEE